MGAFTFKLEFADGTLANPPSFAPSYRRGQPATPSQSDAVRACAWSRFARRQKTKSRCSSSSPFRRATPIYATNGSGGSGSRDGAESEFRAMLGGGFRRCVCVADPAPGIRSRFAELQARQRT
jgi:hypothetical protein